MFRLPLAIALAFAAAASLASQTKLLRHPDIHKDQLVFTYGGDLWRAPTTGGTATRLTSTPGVELFAKFSPDGRWIAFTGQVNGDEQVCVVPSDGGEVRRMILCREMLNHCAPTVIQRLYLIVVVSPKRNQSIVSEGTQRWDSCVSLQQELLIVST